MRATFVNHSTVLIQMDGWNVLTDPTWSERASPLSWLGPRRVRPPGIQFEDLPPIHLVVVSHCHYDHMDVPTLRRLQKVHAPKIVVGLGHRAVLAEHGISVAAELDWWQQFEAAKGLSVTSVPAEHFSNRGLTDWDRTLWGGYVIRTREGHVYFAGDTGVGPHFAAIRERFGAPRLAMLPIGAYRPEWFMSRVHTSPGQAVHAAQVLGARTSIGIHFGTFRLADDGVDEPPRRLADALAALPAPKPDFWVLGFGEGRDVP